MKVLSIEIGTDLTHVIEVDYKIKNPRIYQSFTFQTPFGMVGDSGVKKNEDFRKNLLKNLNSRNIKTRKTVCVINSGKIANREIEIPLVKENRIKALLETNSAEYFPVDLAQYQLVYRTIANPELEKEKKRKLFVLAVPNDLIQSYVELCSFCNLELMGLDYVGNSIYQNMKKTAGPNFSCTIKIDENATIITVINKGQMELQRTIFYGIGEAVELVNESIVFRDKDYDNVREIMSREKCVNASLNEKSSVENAQLAELRDAVTETLRPMIGNISRVFDYYTSRNAEIQIKECVLIGNGANLMGLTELMQNELHIPVLAMTAERSGISGINNSIIITEYVTCYGAALAPFEFSFGEKSGSEISHIKQKHEMLVAQIVFCVFGVVAVGLVTYSLSSHFITERKTQSLRNEKANLAYVQEIYDDFVTVEARYNDVVTMFHHTDSTNDKLADVVEEMETKMPTGMKIISFTSDGQGITLEVEVGSKNEAAKVLDELATFESFSKVGTTGVSEVTDEDGKMVINMMVVCTYIDGDGEPTIEPSTEPAAETDASADVNNESQGE